MRSASRWSRAPNWWSSRPADRTAPKVVRGSRHGQVHRRTALSSSGVGGRGEGLLRRRGTRLRVPRADPLDRRPASQQGRLGRFPEHREGPRGRRELRLPLDGGGRRLERPCAALCRCLLRLAGRHLRARRFAHPHAGRPCRCADLGGLPVGQPLFDDPGAGAVPAARPDQPHIRGRHAVPPPRTLDRRQEPGGGAVQRSVLSRRAARLSQGDRHDLHDRRHDQRQPRSGGCTPLLSVR